MVLTIPAELKKVVPFVRRAEELDKDRSSAESRLVAYYCRQYAVQQGIPLASTSPAAKTCLGQILESLETEKEAMDNFTKQEASYLCRQFAQKVFDKADAEDQLGEATKNTAKTFYAAANFLQILEQFGGDETSEDAADDRKRIIYAKWKATDILKALKEGRKPTPGGYGEADAMGEGSDDEAPKVETVENDDDEGMDMPRAPSKMDAPPPAPFKPPINIPPPMPPPVVPPPKEEPDEEGTEVSLGPPPPAYQPPKDPSPTGAPRHDRPPVTFNLPPMDDDIPAPPKKPMPKPAPKPAPPKSSGMFGFGKKKGGKATKLQIADATELTQFALAALHDKDAELAADRLQKALEALGR